MNTLRFTAEAALYKMSGGQYRIGRHTGNPFEQVVSPVWPAAKKQEGEVIHVHSCPVGWTDYGGTCFPPPVTEPPVGGDGDVGEGMPPYNGPGDVGPYGSKGKHPKTFAEFLKNSGGRYCAPADFSGGREARDKAEQACGKKSTKNVDRQLACFENPDGTASASCCHIFLKNIKKAKGT